MDILERVEEKFGDVGVILFMLSVAICGVIIIGAWFIATGLYIWPIALPFVLLGYIVWSVKNG